MLESLSGLGAGLGSTSQLISAITGAVGTIVDSTFTGLNYSNQQSMNDYNKNLFWGQNSQLFDTLVEGSRGDYDSYMEAYEKNLNNGDWTQRIDKQDMMNMITMDREDSAIQRKVKDAQAAGVNPFYALGGSGSPATSYSASTSSANNLQAPQFQQMASFANLADILSNVEIKKEQAKLLREQADKTASEKNKIDIDALISGKTLGLKDLEGEKLKKEIEHISTQIKVNDAQYKKYMEEVAILQYDLLKSIELDVRYKDQLTMFNFSINKLDKLAGEITNSEFAKDMLLGVGAGLLGATVVGKFGKGAYKVFEPILKKYGSKVKGIASDIFNKFKKNKIDDTNYKGSDFFG